MSVRTWPGEVTAGVSYRSAGSAGARERTEVVISDPAGVQTGRYPAATFGGSVISSQLYGVDGWNGLIVAVAAMTLTACAILAAVIPAHRAGAIDPLEALRAD